MGAIHLQVQRISLERALWAIPALVRRADPMTRAVHPPAPPESPLLPLPARRAYPLHYDRWEVIGRLHDEGPAPGVVLELLSPDQFVNESLNDNPYCHPVRNIVDVEGLERVSVVRPGEEAIVFLTHDIAIGEHPERYAYALDGLCVSPSHAELLRAAIAARRPPPPPPGLFARWWAKIKG